MGYISNLMKVFKKLNLPKEELPNGMDLKLPDGHTVEWLRESIKNNTLPDTVNKEHIAEFLSMYEEYPVYHKELVRRPGEEGSDGNLPDELITKLRAGRVFNTNAKMEDDVYTLIRKVTPQYEETAELFANRIRNAIPGVQMLLIKTDYIYSKYGVEEVYTVSFKILSPLDNA